MTRQLPADSLDIPCFCGIWSFIHTSALRARPCMHSHFAIIGLPSGTPFRTGARFGPTPSAPCRSCFARHTPYMLTCTAQGVIEGSATVCVGGVREMSLSSTS